jgi:uncharacterized protein YndB with AHSA1/START domain
MTDSDHPADPSLDLVLERRLAPSPAAVWAAWTRPELIVRWFTPAPWTTTSAAIDLRPGGTFRTTMRSPTGDEHPQAGCVLAVDPGRRLVWTSAMTAGWRPAPRPADVPAITVEIHLEPDGAGTRYRALVRHEDTTSREAHEKMGFHEGWGAALDQLVAVAGTV